MFETHALKKSVYSYVVTQWSKQVVAQQLTSVITIAYFQS